MDAKNRLRRYDLRTAAGSWLGTVVIADDGYFSAVTDWGTYGYWWSSFGEDFRAFLLEVDSWYLLSKVAPEREYDAAKTAAHVRREIARCVRSGAASREAARNEFARIRDQYRDLDAPESLAMSCTVPIDPTDMMRTSPKHEAVMFCTVVLEALKNAIRAESQTWM